MWGTQYEFGEVWRDHNHEGSFMLGLGVWRLSQWQYPVIERFYREQDAVWSEF